MMKSLHVCRLTYITCKATNIAVLRTFKIPMSEKFRVKRMHSAGLERGSWLCIRKAAACAPFEHGSKNSSLENNQTQKGHPRHGHITVIKIHLYSIVNCENIFFFFFFFL